MSEVQKRWVVGVDLRPSSEGAIRFAAWLAEGGNVHLHGLHVVESDVVRPTLTEHDLEQILAKTDAATRAVVEGAGASAAFAALEVVEGDSAEGELAQAVRTHGAEGLIVGRHAGTKQRTIYRLGRVARRLLRQAEVPVVIVPPDLPAIGAGPVVIATNLEDDCLDAAQFGQGLAARLGRPTLFAHVVSSPKDYGAHYLPEDALKKSYVEHQKTGEAELDAWLAEHGLTPGERVVTQGSAIECLNELAEQRDAAMLVTGSRRLSGLERLFLTSIGTELAAGASCAVAMVPPSK